MQYPDVVRRVFSYASHTNNPELVVLFMRIRKQLVSYVVKSNLEKPSFNLYEDAA